MGLLQEQFTLFTRILIFNIPTSPLKKYCVWQSSDSKRFTAYPKESSYIPKKASLVLKSALASWSESTEGVMILEATILSVASVIIKVAIKVDFNSPKTNFLVPGYLRRSCIRHDRLLIL